MFEDERTIYIPEEEIRTVFYALVIRNQALERRYISGLNDFLEKYGGVYDNEITTLRYMSPEYEIDIRDLELHGAEPDRDFDVVIDDLYGVPSSHKDFEHYPLDDHWLGGYYHDNGVVVFMIN